MLGVDEASGWSEYRLADEPDENQTTVTVLWGMHADDEDDGVAYSFDTATELKAFLLGVDEASGWMDYEVQENP
jgi:hypothetical protein